MLTLLNNGKRHKLKNKAQLKGQTVNIVKLFPIISLVIGFNSIFSSTPIRPYNKLKLWTDKNLMTLQHGLNHLYKIQEEENIAQLKQMRKEEKQKVETVLKALKNGTAAQIGFKLIENSDIWQRFLGPNGEKYSIMKPLPFVSTPNDAKVYRTQEEEINSQLEQMRKKAEKQKIDAENSDIWQISVGPNGKKHFIMKPLLPFVSTPKDSEQKLIQSEQNK